MVFIQTIEHKSCVYHFENRLEVEAWTWTWVWAWAWTLVLHNEKHKRTQTKYNKVRDRVKK
mgnify:FL=1